MPRLLGKLPAYRKHKATGQAVVTLSAATSISARGNRPHRKPSTTAASASGTQPAAS